MRRNGRMKLSCHKKRGIDLYRVSRSNKVAFTPHFCKEDFDAVCPYAGLLEFFALSPSLTKRPIFETFLCVIAVCK
jgi:hypothetical protein